VKQKIEALEAISGALGMGFETQNKYKIKNSLGQVSRSNHRPLNVSRFGSRIDRFSVAIKLVRPGALKEQTIIAYGFITVLPPPTL
jgi:hypothetical protein